MNDFYRKLIEVKGGIVLKTVRKDTRNRNGEFGWVGHSTPFLLGGILWDYRTGFVYPKRNSPVPYNKVVSYDDKLPEMVSKEATEFFSELL